MVAPDAVSPFSPGSHLLIFASTNEGFTGERDDAEGLLGGLKKESVDGKDTVIAEVFEILVKSLGRVEIVL